MIPRDTLDLIRDRLDDLNYKFNLLIKARFHGSGVLRGPGRF
jgi:hypothetical protein